MKPRFIALFLSLTIVLLFSSLQNARSEDRVVPSTFDCNSAMTTAKKDVGYEQLLVAGYPSAVSKRILESRPDIAKEIIRRQKAGDLSGNASTYYRGIFKEPKEFITLAADLPESTMASYMYFFSPDPNVSVVYASCVGLNASNSDSPEGIKYLETHRYGTVVEFKIPDYLGSKDMLQANGQYYEVLIPTSEIPDVKPFITRVGVVDLNKRPQFIRKEGGTKKDWTEKDIQWFNYEDIFKNGVPVNPSIMPK